MVAGGLLPPTATVHDLVTAGTFRLFASGSRDPLKAGRRMGAHRLSTERVGFALWWTAKHVLGRELPDWKALDRQGLFYRILTGHNTRNLIAIFWGRVMGDWEYAATLTNDRADTLRNEYTTDQFAREEHAGDTSHWDHPRAYGNVMLDVKNKSIVVLDPSACGVEMPEPAKELLKQWAQEDRANQRRPTRGTPAGRIRRARPGQLPPSRRP